MLERVALVAWWLTNGDAVSVSMLTAGHGIPARRAQSILDRIEELIEKPALGPTGFERTVYVVGRLARGDSLTTRQIADECGTTRQTAYNTLVRACRVVPIYQVSRRGPWQACDLGEMD
jgi:hypothetical protein